MRRGRRSALITLAAGIAVLAAAALALKDPLLEKWWLHRLGSEDPEAQRAAAEGLGRLGSLKAVGPLLAETRSPHFSFMKVYEAAINALEMIVERHGKVALPYFLAALRTEADPMARAVGVEMLRHLDPSVQAPEPPDGVPADPHLHDAYFRWERPTEGQPSPGVPENEAKDR